MDQHGSTKSAEFPQVKGGVSEGDFKFKLVTVGDSGVRRPKGCRSPKTAMGPEVPGKANEDLH